MACFIVPGTEAIIFTAVTQIVKRRENAHKIERIKIDAEVVNRNTEKEEKLPFSRKLKWLTNMLWGGVVLLAFEHLWHGEVVPWAPFLTATENPADTQVMLHEMGTVGVSMALVVTAAWGGMLIVSHMIEKKAVATQEAVK